MTLGPVLRFELIATARRGRYYSLRAVYGLFLLDTVWSGYRQRGNFFVDRTMTAHDMALFAQSIFSSLGWLQWIAVLIVVTYVLYKILAWLHVRYNDAIGRKMPRQQLAWLKPMSGERRSVEVRRPLNGVERIVVVSVVVAVLAFEIWFFFFAHYTLAS